MLIGFRCLPAIWINKGPKYGFFDILIVNRPGAHQNRADALRGKPKVAGYDLDEAPPAVLRQPGDPVSVRPIIPGDNRSGGSQIGNQLRDVPNGSQIIIIIIINKLN